MPKHPTNKNLTIIKATTFKTLPLGRPRYQGAFEFIEEYLNTNINVMNSALRTHARTLAVRVDLHLPRQASGNASFNNFQEASITRFIKSLKSKIGNHISRTRRNGNSTHRSEVQYVWVCEQGETGQDHYHLVLFLNNDTFRHPGVKRTGEEPSNLIKMIIGAWSSALKIGFDEAWDLVTIPSGASYLLRNTSIPEQAYCDLFKRLSYFAKVKTKVYGENRNSYGSSRLLRHR
ncbi:inovirus Gp2 family protein [Vibrio sp. SG41-7]|uniref:inovirus Gp2 family protein n=1 Tax=Vibrio sp. SG41-7 TaxID=2760973 RepID=UPI0015FF833A|nr:inovirus Gp2 family protein [Vibrio sp. SG41-7]MBB1466593.1 inovirus Gp2 family protein [Vibrio sp. SG41-7]